MEWIFREYQNGTLTKEQKVSSVKEACSLCDAPCPGIEYTLNGVPIWDTLVSDTIELMNELDEFLVNKTAQSGKKVQSE